MFHLPNENVKKNCDWIIWYNIPFPDDDALLWCSSITNNELDNFVAGDVDVLDDNNNDGDSEWGTAPSPSTTPNNGALPPFTSSSPLLRSTFALLLGMFLVPSRRTVADEDVRDPSAEFSPSHAAHHVVSSAVVVVADVIDEVIVHAMTRSWATGSSTKGFLQRRRLHGSHIAAPQLLLLLGLWYSQMRFPSDFFIIMHLLHTSPSFRPFPLFLWLRLWLYPVPAGCLSLGQQTRRCLSSLASNRITCRCFCLFYCSCSEHALSFSGLSIPRPNRMSSSHGSLDILDRRVCNEVLADYNCPSSETELGNCSFW